MGCLWVSDHANKLPSSANHSFIKMIVVSNSAQTRGDTHQLETCLEESPGFLPSQQLSHWRCAHALMKWKDLVSKIQDTIIDDHLDILKLMKEASAFRKASYQCVCLNKLRGRWRRSIREVFLTGFIQRPADVTSCSPLTTQGAGVFHASQKKQGFKITLKSEERCAAEMDCYRSQKHPEELTEKTRTWHPFFVTLVFFSKDGRCTLKNITSVLSGVLVCRRPQEKYFFGATLSENGKLSSFECQQKDITLQSSPCSHCVSPPAD